MMKKNLLRLGALVLAVALCLSCVACKPKDDPNSTTGSGEQVTYTVKVTTQAGQAMEGVGVYIYTDSPSGDLIWFDTTDENGAMTFTNVQRDNYVAVLKDVPTGYEVEESYPITGPVTEIKLAAGVLDPDNMDDIRYKLGDMMMDFTVTGTDGTEYTMSEILKEKKAIVLNFWYINCSFCVAEFPYLQEAYEQYGDQVEFLALNPIDNNADAIAAFKEEHKLTFPVCAVDPKWGDMFSLTGYPTTVIIDRFGNISLWHNAAAIESTKQLADALEYYIAEDYEAGVIEDINDLAIQEEVGSESNPEQLGASDMFEVTVGPGQVYYNEIGKVQQVYLTIYSNDAYIIYEGKTYKPQNGVVSVMISAPDMYTPAKVGYGNSGSEKQTFKVYMSSIRGSMMNPYALTLGEFTAKVNAGNDQGIYYEWTAKEEGFLTMKCLSATSGVNYMYYLFNLNSSAQRQLDTDSEEGADGKRFVTMPVEKGQKVRFSIGTLPDSSNSYPAGTFKMLAEFTAGDIHAGQVQVEKATYTVSVVDNTGKAMSGINMKVQGTQEENKDVSVVLTTGEDGKVSQELPKGEYTVTLTTPKGYTVDQQTLPLTSDILSGIFTVSPIVITHADYTITVVDPEGAPMAGLQVIIQGSKGSGLGITDENGVYTQQNLETDSYTVYIMGYDTAVYAGEVSYTIPENETTLTVKLTYVPGTEKNPIVVEALPYTTDSIKANTGLYYTLSGVAGKQLEIVDTDAYVILNNTTYGANRGGVVIVPMGSEDTVTLIVGNSGTAAESYTLKLNALYGSAENPEPISPSDSLEIELAAGDTDGHTYRWTATDNGKLTVSGEGVTVVLTNTSTGETCGAGEALSVALGETVTVQVKASDEALPAVKTTLAWSFATGGDVTPDDSTNTEDTSDTTDTSETTEPETQPSESETTEPETEPSVPPTTEPEDNILTYTVTVTDYAGKPSASTSLMIQKNGVPVKTGITDANGKFSAQLDAGDYTVSLLVTGLHYDPADAVLSASDPDALILLAKVLDESNSQSFASNVDGEGMAYELVPGGYYVVCEPGEIGYSTKFGATLFSVFFEQPGKYRVTVTNPALLIDRYNNSFYSFKQYLTLENENALEIDVYENGQRDYLVGLEGAGTGILKITRLGEPGFNPNFVDPVEYVGSGNPKKYTYSGSAVTYVNACDPNTSNYTLVYNDEDGYYHLNAKNGPVVYANMGTVTTVNSISLKTMIYGFEGDGQTLGGSSVYYSYYDEYGAFHKEDFTTLLRAYIENSDSATGLYPLTKDLEYMLKNGLASKIGDWGDPSHSGYIFGTETVNPDLFWMFVLCYVK